MPPRTKKRNKDSCEQSNTDKPSASKRSRNVTALETEEDSSNNVEVRVKMKATHANDINVRAEQDTRTCYITGSVLLFGDRLVVADFHNEKLKLINTASNQVLSEFKFHETNVEAAALGYSVFNGPWDLAAVSIKEIAATYPNRKEIVVVKVGKRDLRVDRKIPVNGRCRGIVYKDPNFLLVFDTLVKFETITTQGDVLNSADWTLAPLQATSFFRLQQPYGEHIYVSDYKTNCLSLVTVLGNVENKFTDFSSFSANGLCTGLGGFVFVCDSRGNKIHVLSVDLSRKITSLSVKGVKEPISLTCCEQNKHLYIGMHGDTVTVANVSCTKK